MHVFGTTELIKLADSWRHATFIYLYMHATKARAFSQRTLQNVMYHHPIISEVSDVLVQ